MQHLQLNWNPLWTKCSSQTRAGLICYIFLNPWNNPWFCVVFFYMLFLYIIVSLFFRFSSFAMSHYQFLLEYQLKKPFGTTASVLLFCHIKAMCMVVHLFLIFGVLLIWCLIQILSHNFNMPNLQISSCFLLTIGYCHTLRHTMDLQETAP